MHIPTLLLSPLTAAALENIRLIETEHLIGNAACQGELFLEGLQKLSEKYASIGDVRGKGLAIGVELVEDPVTKKPDAVTTAAVCYRAYELGVLIYNVGIYGNVLEITPPLIISSEEVQEALRILDRAFEDVEAGLVDLETVPKYGGWG